MVTCPECRGEGKVRTAKEKAQPLLRRAGLVAAMLALFPAAVELFYWLGRFVLSVVGASALHFVEMRTEIGNYPYSRTVYLQVADGPAYVLIFAVVLGCIAGLIAVGVFFEEVVKPRWSR